MHRSFFPEMESNRLNIMVAYPGASPQEMEEGVTTKLEEALKTISGIEEITSTSAENFSTIYVECYTDEDIDEMLTKVKNAVDGVNGLPIASEQPLVVKNEAGRIYGLIVERGMDGFSTPEMHGKLSLRASATGELIFDNVRVPKSNILPGRSGLGAPLSCLDSARFGIAWGALGAAMDCYDQALRYSKERTQFDVPIGSFQLIQKKLAEMITEITKAQLLTFRLGELRNDGKATSAQISMAKRNNVEIALNIAREARQIHGGMGITSEYSMMRHMANLESVLTYEGTHDIHLLITGMDVTGIPSFTRDLPK